MLLSEKSQKRRAERSGNSRKRSDPKATIERILDAAHLVLIRKGQAGFTIRRVSEISGILLGNITYHFPSKTDLLRAFIEKLTQNKLRQFEEILANSSVTTPEEIESLVRLLMRETVSEEATRVYREIWVLALDDEVISDAVNRLYDQCMGSFVEHLSRAYPDLDVAVLQEFAQTLAVMLEGTCVLYGTRCDRVVPYERSVQISIELLRGMLQKGQIGPPRI